jgi:hypothetical protein
MRFVDPVRFVVKGDRNRKSGSFDHFIRGSEQRRSDSEAERACRVAVDDQLVFGRLLNREIAGFLAAQDSVDVVGNPFRADNRLRAPVAGKAKQISGPRGPPADGYGTARDRSLGACQFKVLDFGHGGGSPRSWLFPETCKPNERNSAV